jgi:hypothetical protein
MHGRPHRKERTQVVIVARTLGEDVKKPLPASQFLPRNTVLTANQGCPIPPDFLWGLVESPNFMRLSSKKAAHATMGGAVYRNPGI